MNATINQFVSGWIGLTHLITAVLALVFGTLNLLQAKGTLAHKRIGYGYAASMSIMLLTAFLLYNLFGKWGVFHWAAVVSSLTLSAGLIPVILRTKNYLTLHFAFMYWSVMGLYGALTAEGLVRLPRVVRESGIPNSTFYTMTGIAVGATMVAGGIFFIKLSASWQRQFNRLYITNKNHNKLNN